MAEFGDPYELLQDEKSQLKKMADKTGTLCADKLYQMAEKANYGRKKI